VRSLGRDRVIDYTQEDFTKKGETYDVIFDAVGKLSFGRCKRSLNQGGIYMSTDLGPLHQNPLLAVWTSRIGSKKVKFPIPRYKKQDVLFFKDLIEAGKYQAVIDRRYALEQDVDAPGTWKRSRRRENIVLTVSHDPRRRSRRSRRR
jgi:NADPH:quinone reductase-like Zn-dependent oxidoreductase